MAVNIKLEEVRKYIIDDARQIEKKYRQSVKDAVKDEADTVFNNTIVSIMLKYQSGNHPNADAILNAMYKKQLDSSGYRWEVGNTHYLSGLLEYGSPRHDIYAAPDSWLIFEVPTIDDIKDPVRRAYARAHPDKRGKYGGYTIFTKHVDHPGFKGYKFLSQAVIDSNGVFEKRLKHYLSQISL